MGLGISGKGCPGRFLDYDTSDILAPDAAARKRIADYLKRKPAFRDIDRGQWVDRMLWIPLAPLPRGAQDLLHRQMKGFESLQSDEDERVTRGTLEQGILPNWLQNRRWFAGKDAAIEKVNLVYGVRFGDAQHPVLLSEIEVTSGGQTSRYHCEIFF